MNAFRLLKGFIDNLPPAVKAELANICKQMYLQCRQIAVARAIELLTKTKH
jgi:hypothetical protein